MDFSVLFEEPSLDLIPAVAKVGGFLSAPPPADSAQAAPPVVSQAPSQSYIANGAAALQGAAPEPSTHAVFPPADLHYGKDTLADALEFVAVPAPAAADIAPVAVGDTSWRPSLDDFASSGYDATGMAIATLFDHIAPLSLADYVS